MKRLLPLVLLLALGAASTHGCSSPDAAVLDDVLREIANVGSQAKVAGPRSPEEIERTTAQVTSLQAHVRSHWK